MKEESLPDGASSSSSNAESAAAPAEAPVAEALLRKAVKHETRCHQTRRQQSRFDRSERGIFGLEPRADILHRVVRWQRNNAQAGTHKVKTRSEVNYSTKKIYRQKGTGGARHGARSAPIFRGGGVYKGPTPRSHGHDLTKKFRHWV